jgi:hypothetical protein
MAIRTMLPNDAAEYPEGAFCPLEWRREQVCVYDYAHGMVVSEREMNGYDDSDFYATYWDGEKFVETMVGTTRGWSYPCGSNIDAGPELMAQYEAHLKQRDRARRALVKRIDRKRLMQDARDAGLKSYLVAKDLRGQMGRDRYAALIKLLASEQGGRLRSKFRKSLAAQVRNWLADPAPKYRLPLSPRQMGYL